MAKTTEESNKALVLEAFDTLFNKRDYKAAERYWSSDYIQHGAHIPPGRDGLFTLVRSMPPTLKYESGEIVAENDYVIVHGRFSGTGRPRNWIAADIVRVVDGALAEHWDVLQDEVIKAESRSGLPMFGTSFPVSEASLSSWVSPLNPKDQPKPFSAFGTWPTSIPTLSMSALGGKADIRDPRSVIGCAIAIPHGSLWKWPGRPP